MTPSSARTGRPRDSRTDRRVLDVAAAALAEGGYQAMSMGGVAAQAGVAKTTIYRRWPSKDHLVASLITKMLADVPLPDTGGLDKDLTALVTDITTALEALPGARGLVAELVAAAARHPDLGETIRAMWRSRRQGTFQLLRGAIRRGELRADTDLELLVDQLVAPLYYRLLITGDPISPAYAATVVKATLRAVRAHPGDSA